MPETSPSLARLHRLAMRHATPEEREHILRLTAGMAPSEYYKPLEHGSYVAGCTAILFERVFAELAELRAMVQGLAELDAGPRGPRGSASGASKVKA
jgi:hypothetical protein